MTTNVAATETEMKARGAPLSVGEPAPWFRARSPVNPQFMFATLAGRFVGLVFLGRSTAPGCNAFLTALANANLDTDDARCVRYCVSNDIADQDNELVGKAFPPQRVFHDSGGRIAAAYGLGAGDPSIRENSSAAGWYIVDPMLRVYAAGGLDQVDAFIEALRSVPQSDDHVGSGVDLWAPVLLVPRVLEPELCRTLIDAYEAGQPAASGFMRTENGKTVLRTDPEFKRRSDLALDDEGLQDALRTRVRERIVPEISKAFQFTVTRIERYIVACYDASETGYFSAHRDNLTKGTAHRRFAVTINLNADDYDGGELVFPEFGSRRYKPPTGGAVVFSCTLLHEATPVTRGRRYATLPFLYDDAAAEIRAANLKYLDESLRPLASPPEAPDAGVAEDKT